MLLLSPIETFPVRSVAPRVLVQHFESGKNSPVSSFQYVVALNVRHKAIT